MRKNTTLGVIVILVGIIWLLSNLNLFSFSLIDVFFRALGELWPLILIGIGVNILLKENAVLRLLVWLIIFTAILLYGLYGINAGSWEYEVPPADTSYKASHVNTFQAATRMISFSPRFHSFTYNIY
jgi:hypothetical protein